MSKNFLKSPGTTEDETPAGSTFSIRKKSIFNPNEIFDFYFNVKNSGFFCRLKKLLQVFYIFKVVKIIVCSRSCRSEDVLRILCFYLKNFATQFRPKSRCHKKGECAVTSKLRQHKLQRSSCCSLTVTPTTEPLNFCFLTDKNSFWCRTYLRIPEF